MHLVSLKQGSEEWLRFRRSHICASDASSILQCNPYKSILDLYEEKVFGFEQDKNHFMYRGLALEPLALEAFEDYTGWTLLPVVVKHASINWMAASLDGMTINQDAIVEVKCNGKKNHELALKGKLPRHYKAQIQHQLECTGLDCAYYYSFDGEAGVIIEVPRDQEFIEIMLEKEREFWNCLQTFTPPKIMPKRTRQKNAVAVIP
jgi:putative phage-type endonuclease